jgi:hypothetical protein
MPHRSLAMLLVAGFALILIACRSVEAGSWVVHEPETGLKSSSIYHVLEKKSPFGVNEKNEDPDGYRRICLLLRFDEQSAADSAIGSDGEERYAAQPLDDATWELCRELATTDKPLLVTSAIPGELAEELGIE